METSTFSFLLLEKGRVCARGEADRAEVQDSEGDERRGDRELNEKKLLLGHLLWRNS